jgi:hypothetical protein
MAMDDKPASRTIRIGNGSVGLLGLEQAMQKALKMQEGEEEAVEFLYLAVASQNYIPAKGASLYREALRREYRKRSGKRVDDEGGLDIRILGKACLSCNRLNTMVFDILQRLGIAADIVLVHDPDEIGRFGVLSTPALVINGEVKSAGRLPLPVQVEEWLLEAVTRTP